MIECGALMLKSCAASDTGLEEEDHEVEDCLGAEEEECRVEGAEQRARVPGWLVRKS